MAHTTFRLTFRRFLLLLGVGLLVLDMLLYYGTGVVRDKPLPPYSPLERIITVFKFEEHAIWQPDWNPWLRELEKSECP